MNNLVISPALIVVLAFLVLAVVALVGWSTNQRRHSDMLRERFGPEYQHTVQELGDRRKAEQELESRTKRVGALDIHDISAEQRARFSDAWRLTQAHFVDNPQGAVKDADRLVTEAMNARGYPMGTFEQRAADISVDHASVVENYRAAHHVAGLNEKGSATTEDLRKAMVYYRNLFNDLLATADRVAEEVKR